MHNKEIELKEVRAKQFIDRIKDRILTDSEPLAAEFRWSSDAIAFESRLNGEFKPIKEGERWGETWDSAWFRLQGTIPDGWQGRKIVAQLEFNGEAMVFSNSGVPLQGLTNGSVFKENFAREIFPVSDSCRGGEQIELWVEAAANQIFGVALEADPPKNCPTRYGYYEGKMNRARLCVFDSEMWHFMLDFEVLLDLQKELQSESPRRAKILHALCKAMDAFLENSENTSKCRAILKKELDKKSGASELSMAAVGHAHIDTGWLWRVCESKRKCGRTFSSQIALLERYPEYVFGASQPQHYAFVKEHYPELYEKIKHYIKEGRWECQGAMWVEADCNVISGESMVRQIIHGKNFFMDEFGVETKDVWIPDVFGYSANMPQIMKRSGLDYFVTQKISWNFYNEFPHNTFNWRGIDGSEVITHFPPENTYNSELMPNTALPAQKRFKEKHFLDEFLSLFGVGNGGGGPKEEHIEHALRLADTEGHPKVKFGKALDFLKRLSERKSELATWVGELYLEYHRGTFTTQALVKKRNRQLEQKLREVEFLFSCLPLKNYPTADLDWTWKTLLRNQFHDILPGSSIREVYQDTHKEYCECLGKCAGLNAIAAEAMFEKDDNALVLFNCLSCAYDAPVELPENWENCAVFDSDGNAVPIQKEEGRVVAMAHVPPQGFATLKKADGTPEAIQTQQELVLENSLMRYEFENDGTLSRAWDKEARREVLKPGQKGNVFSLYVDRPHIYDAWEIDIYYENELIEHARSTEALYLGKGKVRQGMRFALEIGNSKIVQEVFLSSNSKQLDFNTVIDWNEKHRMLRTAFPINVNSEQASFDIQYGHLKRNTHRNTSWDMAKFEVCGQRYADISGSDFGAALLNDCKYGYKVYENILDLNLLRSPNHPDPDADIGRHSFTYSLLPHCGDLTHSDVIPKAAQLTQGIAMFEGFSALNAKAPCKLEGEGLSLEVLKKAEKENCLILRIVETLGNNSSGVLHVADPEMTLVETNLMEWTEGELYSCDKPIELSLVPFEIRTYKLKAAK